MKLIRPKFGKPQKPTIYTITETMSIRPKYGNPRKPTICNITKTKYMEIAHNMTNISY